jgi:predicted DCC family thiol-disulfide oxidoreductase YuxK
MPSQTPGLLDRLGLSRADADRWVWVVQPSGERRYGATAVATVLQLMQGPWKLLGRLAELPGGDAIYRLVARNRSLLSRVWSDPPPYGRQT